jgi:hypothetical protein
MLLENVAHVGLGEIDDGGGGLVEFSAAAEKRSRDATDRQRSEIPVIIIGRIRAKGVAYGKKA